MKKLKSSNKETDWKKLSGLSEIKQFEKVGDVFIGKLLSYKEDAGKYSNGIFEFEEITTKKIYSIWNTASLSALMGLKMGSVVKLVYLGIQKSKKNRKVKAFEVFVK